MIDWISLLVNSMWILAAALALAGVGYASWQARRQNARLCTVLGRPGFGSLFDLAGILFCVSGIFTAPEWWLGLAWLVLSLGFIIHFLSKLKRSPKLSTG